MTAVRPTIAGHLAIMRVDHWFKNVFVLPGIAVALSVLPDPMADLRGHLVRVVVGLVSICLVASSNYTINELLDAPFDLHHPTKSSRPVPAGLVHPTLAYVQWLVLMALGVGLGLWISPAYATTVGVLWLMGCIYNIPPLRSKDLPYLDVLSESVNNPLRMLAGWYSIGAEVVPPASLLLSYWMIGAYFMAMIRQGRH